MGLLNRLLDRLGRARASGRGASLEARGRLEDAFQAYREGGQPAEAARVMVAIAQAESDPSRRLAMLALATSCAPAGSPERADAMRRRAMLSLDLARQSPGSLLPSELRQLAEELEASGVIREAAEVRGMMGDLDSRARLLAACGAIDALESTLAAERDLRTSKTTREQTWNRIRDLAALGRRLEAIALCGQWGADHPADDDVAAFARGLRDKLVRGPCAAVRFEGEPVTVALGCPVTLGRSDSTISLPTPVLSRRHLQFDQGPQGPMVSDLQSRNGTLMAGARIAGPIPVGAGVELSLGGQLPCRVEPFGKGVQLSLGGQRWLVPLGPLAIGPFEVLQGDECVQLRGPAPVLGTLLADVPVDLCAGDEIRAERGGPLLLEVMQ